MNNDTLQQLYILLILFIGFLIILWILLPFAVFGIKDRLDKIIKLQQQLLEAQTGATISKEVIDAAETPAPPPPRPRAPHPTAPDGASINLTRPAPPPKSAG